MKVWFSSAKFSVVKWAPFPGQPFSPAFISLFSPFPGRLEALPYILWASPRCSHEQIGSF